LAHAFDFRDDTGRRTGVYLSTGNRSFIEIFESAHEDYAETQSYKHLCLEVDDIEKAVAELVARGVETTPPFFGDDNSWQAWLTDPDGNRIELHAYTPKSKQLGGG
jgi:lactoylglutathione lyase/glyoxylase I family protein